MKTEAGEPGKEQQMQPMQAPVAAASDSTDTKRALVGEETKSSAKTSKREHGVKQGSHGDSDSSATCSADEVEESDNGEKNR